MNRGRSTSDDAKCPKCGGTGEIWLGSQPYGSPGEAYMPCPDCWRKSDDKDEEC